MKPRLGRYAIVRRLPALDREVYLATEDDRERLLVVVPSDAEATGVIDDEVRRVRLIKHRAVLPVLEMFEDAGQRTLVFEHLAGATLTQLGEDLSKRGELLSEASIWHVGYECAAALAAAHSVKGGPVVHGHLMPDHVIVTWEGGVRLLGLGLSSLMALQEAPTIDAFRSPEMRAGGAPGPSADAYALAAILWWLVTGQLPPTDGPVPRISGMGRQVPLAVGVALQRALSPSPDKRIDCRRLASVLQRPARSGQTELAWNMEMLRALSANDPAPSSKAFSRSAKPEASVEPPSSVIPAPSSPPARSRLGTPISRVEQRHRFAELSDLEDTAETEDTEETDEHSLHADELSTDDGEPTGERGRGDTEPTNPRYLSQPVPAVVTDESTGSDDEPTTNYHRRVREREDTEVVPPDVLRRETEADAAAVRKQRWQSLTRPRNLIVVACLAAVIGVQQWLGSASAPVEEVAAPAQVLPDKADPVPSVVPTAGASAVAATASANEPLPRDMGHLVVVTDLSADDAGVYVFGDYVGRTNERLVVRCGRVFVRLGTRPPRGAPGRRWLSPGHTTQVVCGAVTIVTIEPYPMVGAPVAARRPVHSRPATTPPVSREPAKPDSTWLPDDL